MTSRRPSRLKSPAITLRQSAPSYQAPHNSFSNPCGVFFPNHHCPAEVRARMSHHRRDQSHPTNSRAIQHRGSIGQLVLNRTHFLRSSGVSTTLRLFARQDLVGSRTSPRSHRTFLGQEVQWTESTDRSCQILRGISNAEVACGIHCDALTAIRKASAKSVRPP